jgi:hypothetical protein
MSEYCRIEARKRLLQQGVGIIPAIEISEDIWRIINGKNISKNGQQCNCETGKTQ